MTKTRKLYLLVASALLLLLLSFVTLTWEGSVVSSSLKQAFVQYNTTRHVPVLVILVGPPKTATSTLQEYLSDPKTQAALKKDNYLYQGRFSKGKTPRLLHTLKDKGCKQATKRAREKEGEATPRCWNKFTEKLDRLYQTGQNVILVEEFLSEASFDLPSFQQATAKWQVIIVVTYRQLWSWLPSFKNQREKYALKKRNFPKPKSTDPLPWLLDRRRTTSSPDFYKAMISATNRKAIRVGDARSSLPYTDTVVNFYRDLEEDQLRIMNIHLDNIAVTSNFLCLILPNATNSCQASLNRTKQQRRNPSIQMDYHLIAVDALDLGLLDLDQSNKLTRAIVVRILEQYHKKKLESRPLPLECMDQVSLDALLVESMRLEQELVPDFYAFHQEQHRTNFWNAAAKNKFCSVNTTAVLIDPDWLSLFQHLKESANASDSNFFHVLRNKPKLVGSTGRDDE
jgi:hypothetical protein